MLPLRDQNPTRRVPVLTIGLILANLAVFLYQLRKPDDGSPGSVQAFQCEFGLVPDHLIDGHVHTNPAFLTCAEVSARENRFLGLFTSQFLHGGWWHLLGNMLFLWVFGNNVEDRLGRIRFLPFYLLCGAIAGLAQSATDPQSDVPLIGASGAIAGVLGAYLVLYPKARVWTLVIVVPVLLPAFVVLAFWFVYQFFYAAGAGAAGGGTAYWAHVAGFVAGMLLIHPFLIGRRAPPPPPGRSAGPIVWDRSGLPPPS